MFWFILMFEIMEGYVEECGVEEIYVWFLSFFMDEGVFGDDDDC